MAGRLTIGILLTLIGLATYCQGILNDSLFGETVSRQIKQLEVEYETEKNKNEITQLNQRNQLQQSLPEE